MVDLTSSLGMYVVIGLGQIKSCLLLRLVNRGRLNKLNVNRKFLTMTYPNYCRYWLLL